MTRDFTDEDEGKMVVTADGDTVGTVESVSGSMAQVRPDEDLSRSIRRRLGWAEEGEETYQLESSKVDEIADDEIRITANR